MTSFVIKLFALSLLIFLSGCSNTIVKMPIDLYQAGNVAEANFEIPQDDRVALHLWFFINDQPNDRSRLLDFLGNVLKPEKEVSIPLSVKLIKHVDSKESIILDKTYITTGLGRSSSARLTRLVDNLTLKKGDYRIRLETLKAFPQLTNTKTQFELYYIRAPK